jgi:hypothetical protein
MGGGDIKRKMSQDVLAPALHDIRNLPILGPPPYSMIDPSISSFDNIYTPPLTPSPTVKHEQEQQEVQKLQGTQRSPLRKFTNQALI